MPQVHKRAAAKRDLIEHYVYLAEEAGIDIADRFLLNAARSFNDLALHPEMGASLILQEPRLTGLRRWQVKGFEKFLVFYLPRPGGVSIVRVLHAAQDWWGLFSIV